MKATTEKAFETYIQETLLNHGWVSGSLKEWDKQKAIFPQYILSFIKETQNNLWQKMQILHKNENELEKKFIDTLLKERAIKGTLHIVRHGFKFYGEIFKPAYYKPSHQLVKETQTQFEKNLLHVTRQVSCHPQDNSSVDMLLSLNGIPLATVELKNPATGQTHRDAIAQYKNSRDPNAPLFAFKKGTLVHFAVDPNEIYMTTKLNKDKTYFLPFNRGSTPHEIECGKGNPLHPSGHRTGYFWEETLERESFLNIIFHFIFLEKFEKIKNSAVGRTKETKEQMIFPRYHQLDVIRKLVKVSATEHAGKNYLIQHSAGSGKTNSIAWLAHHLSNLHDKANNKIFDSVVVITDRRVLDKQLQDAVYQIEHAEGVVKAIDKDAKQLAQALVDGTKIVITTLQKFPFILRGLLRVAGAVDPDKPDDASSAKALEWQEIISKRNYAVIVDEAHSSQSGETAKELKAILGAGKEHAANDDDANDDDENKPDWEDNLNAVMESRGQQKNISFFAFTATPKGKTIDLFGTKGADGIPVAFHTYSMKQAIEEGFILDVLQQYTTYKTYYRLLKKAGDDPNMSKKKALKKLTKFALLHPHNIEQKTEIMVEHFRKNVKNKLNGRAKAMVVTGSRLSAIRYMLSFQKYIKENKYTDIRPLVAFSGTVKDPDTDKEFSESSMNIDVVTKKNILESQLPEKFDSPDYQVLLVAEKYQTGFDQPLLCAMYVDKRLDGVQAVQTLSRLNRTSPGKEAPFVLDFVNTTEDIYLAFKPYYNKTILEQPADPIHLEKLKYELDAVRVYFWSEVENFCYIFYLPQHKQRASDHARMEKIIQPAVERFKNLDKENQESFHDKIIAFKKLYAFISQIMPYSDKELEMLYGYARYLVPHLPGDEDEAIPHPEKKVMLEYYRIEKEMSGSIVMEPGQPYGVKSPTAVGGGKEEDEKKPLSEIIDMLNDKFGTDFSDEDRLFFEQIKEKAVKNSIVIETAEANSFDKFELGIKKIIETLMMQRMAENDTIVTRYMDDADFQKTIFSILAKEIYRDISSSQKI